MPRARQNLVTAQRKIGTGDKSLTGVERASLVRLAAALQNLRLEEGHVLADVQNIVTVRTFLELVDETASILKAKMACRSYREFFTANYRSLLPSHGRFYLSEVLVASISQASQGFLCVNGDMHPLPIECQSRGATLQIALMGLGTNLKRLVDEAHLKPEAQIKKQRLCEALREFDEAWCDFEREYINTLIGIEAKSRAPLVAAIYLEKFMGAPCGLHSFQRAALERFLDCLPNLIAKVQKRNVRTDDKLDPDVLISASLDCHDHDNWVRSVLANRVVQSFDTLRKYLQTVEKNIDQAHPDLHLNPGLVEKLEAVKQSWNLYDQWCQHGSHNKALNHVIAVARRAMQTRSSFKNMCEECDPELFLVLPRMVLLCFLQDPTAFRGVISKFLPDTLCGEDDAKTHQPSGLERVLMAIYCSTFSMLRGAHLKTASFDSASQSNRVFDLLIQRAILGNTDDEKTLYKDIDVASHGAAASTVDSFMRELEGYSLELQRHAPEAWNTFTALFVTCVADELPKAHEQKFHI